MEPVRAYASIFIIPLIFFCQSAMAQAGQWNDHGYAPRFRNVNANYIFSNGTIIAAGGNPVNDSISSIFFSNDSAQSWNLVIDAVKAELHDLHFPTHTIGYVVGDAGTIYKSTDGGQNFNAISTTGPILKRNLHAVWFASSDTGIAVGGLQDSLQSIFRTTDGGQSWSTIRDQAGAMLRSICFTDGNTAYAAGDQGSMLKSSDGGLNWSSLSLPTAITNRQLHDLHFIDSQTGLVVGGHPTKDSIETIIRTSDAGNTWSIIADAPAAMLRSVTFYNANEGYISGDYGNLKYSSDKGQSWNEISLPGNDSMHLYDLSFYSPAFGIATGQYGKVWVFQDSNAAAPRAYIDDPVLITDSNSAWINGEVISPAASFQAAFEYGTTAALGNSVSLWQGRVQGDSTQVGIHLQNLQPHSSYYGRIKTTNLHGTAYSQTVRFYTNAAVAPNFDFEDWQSSHHTRLVAWETAGSLRKVASYDGSTAAEVQANNNNAPGAILYASVNNGVIRPLPYQGRPDSITFSALTNLAPGDTAYVYLEMKNGANQLAFQLFPITSSSGQFQHYNIPINYQAAGSADSLALIFVSTNYFGGSPSTQSTLAVDNLMLHGSSLQLANSDMESWDTDTIRNPVHWHSDQQGDHDLSAMQTVQRSPHSHGGKYALYLQNDTTRNRFAYLASGTSDSTSKFILPLKPLSFNGYYQFSPDQGDSLFISSSFYQNGQQIGFARFIATQAQSQYALFHAPIQYFGSGQPDSASISIRIGKGHVQTSVGASSALIDNLTFDGKVLHQPEASQAEGQAVLSYYPNPVREKLTLTVSKTQEPELLKAEILDQRGRRVRQLYLKTGEATTIDMETLSSQCYLLLIYFRDELRSYKIEKI